jgi:3-keto-5-aminohexanoate cleavage enzyme
MNKAMEKIKSKYGDVDTTYIKMFSDLYCDMRALPKWPIPELCAVTTAIVGSFITKKQNPNQPISTDEILKESLNSIEAGATAIHLHVRDEKTGIAVMDTSMLRKVIDPIREKYGDKVFVEGCSFMGDTFEHQFSTVTEGLFELTYVAPFAGYAADTVRYQSPQLVQAGTEYMQEMGVAVGIGIQDTGNIDNMKRWLIDTGILKKPYHWGILAGIPGGLHMSSPRTMIESLSTMVNAIREVDKDPVITVLAGGRSQIYATTLAVMMGLHVRVGMEDTIWRYPHKDELLPDNGTVTKSICQVVEILGRRVATADEYRKMIGLK